ncbi:MAG TPA: class I SAM-dependent methyltransferase [Nitrososphaerales archaeon]|nr:class I SAM-dependent methyltransferase [Nitrososphaerales archaeon]
MNSDEFAKVLMDEGRKEWQNPKAILEQIGVSSGMTVADIACGPGFFTLPFCEAVGPTGHVYAVDHNSVIIENLRKNITIFAPSGDQIELSNIHIMEEQASRTNIPEHSVDVIFFANVLHDIEDKRGFFQEMKRIAKSEAKFVDVDWHKRSMEMGPPLETRLSEGEARRILKDAGLQIVHAIDAGPHHYGLVAVVI